jgi:hypothetical protein
LLQGELFVLQVTDLVLDVDQLVVQVIEHVPKELLLWLDALVEFPVFTFLSVELFSLESVLKFLEHLKLLVEVVDDV